MSLDRFSEYFKEVHLNSPDLLSKTPDQFAITKDDLLKRGMDPSQDFSKVYYIAVLVEKIKAFYPIKIIRFLDFQISIQKQPLEWVEEVAQVLCIFKNGFGRWLGLFPLDEDVANNCIDLLGKRAIDQRHANYDKEIKRRLSALTPFVDKIDRFLKVEQAMVDEGWLSINREAVEKRGVKAALALVGYLMLQEKYFNKHINNGTKKVELHDVKDFFESYFSVTFSGEFTDSAIKKRAKGTWHGNNFFPTYFSQSSRP